MTYLTLLAHEYSPTATVCARLPVLRVNASVKNGLARERERQRQRERERQRDRERQRERERERAFIATAKAVIYWQHVKLLLKVSKFANYRI